MNTAQSWMGGLGGVGVLTFVVSCQHEDGISTGWFLVDPLYVDGLIDLGCQVRPFG